MPPRKRKAQQPEPDPAAPPARVTRAVAKRSAADSASGPVAELPEPQVPEKKTKRAKGAGKGSKHKKQEHEKDGDGAPAETTGGEEKVEGDAGNVDGGSQKTIVIERCTQCNSFKTRATLVKEGLEKGVPGITVIVNPEKPRRGCFEIREDGGQKFISLLDMKRPFTPMKDLDMDKVISDIVDKINCRDIKQ